MPPGREGQLQLGEPACAPALVERQGDRDVRPLDQALAIGEEAIDQPGKAWRGGVEGGANGIGRYLLQLTSYNGGEHGLRQICSIRVDMEPLLLRSLGKVGGGTRRSHD